jgi:uncharacterized protein YyaL (SSP411 family)
MSAESPKHTNALVHEKSPYLLQHAHNPVDWMPWGPAAFEKARKEDKPIFLSVGYSTCHWCHVMEHESFESEEVAAILNENFVNIKVDREERPDVDLTYMTYVQAVSHGGGWPMSVWLTPELKPFYGGTYYPPEDKYGRTGFKTILREIAKVWKEDKANVVARSTAAIDKLQEILNGEQTHHDVVYETVAQKAYDDIAHGFDYHEGGFSGAPKFPRPSLMSALWRLKSFVKSNSDHEGEWCGEMVKKTLVGMAHGGIRDHIGGGFHRYSVDGYWHVPHYEKMLYDQGQLLTAYVEGYQNTGIEFFAEIARSIIEYVKRDLRHPDGGFFSAEDADSLAAADSPKKTEGAFYVWKASEIDELLGKEEGSIFRYAFGARRDGNARPESDPHEELKGLNTLFRAFSVKKTAEYFKLDDAKVADILLRGRKTLFEARAKRPRPHLDDKVLTAWNGLMISGLAKAASALGDADALKLANQATQFIHDRLCVTPGKDLRRSWREGSSNIPAFAADYAMLIQALLDLYEAGFDSKWLQWAVGLQDEFDGLYWDKEHSGYFSVSRSMPDSILSVKDDSDSAEPSPNSVAALNLLRLASMLGRDDLRERAGAILKLFGSSLEKHPFSMPVMVAALDFQKRGDMEIVLAGDKDDAGFKALAATVRKKFLPHTVLLHADGADGQKFLGTKNEAIAGMSPVGGKAAAYVCKNQSCQAPVTTVEALEKLLER